MTTSQREIPVANTPDQHRYDDWTGQLAAELAQTLPSDDDRMRFYESLIRAGVWALYHEHGYWTAREFADAIKEAIEAEWHEECERRRDAKPNTKAG